MWTCWSTHDGESTRLCDMIRPRAFAAGHCSSGFHPEAKHSALPADQRLVVSRGRFLRE